MPTFLTRTPQPAGRIGGTTPATPAARLVWNGSTWSGGANLNIQPDVANAANYPDTRSLNDLTEECFHTGSWATVMASDISFTIVPEPSILSLLPLGSSILLVRRVRSRRS